MKAVRNMSLRAPKPSTSKRENKQLILECQGSSIGTYSTAWMNSFYHSAKGESAGDWLDESKKKRDALDYPPIKIVFPTLKRVRETTLGEPVSV